MAGHTEPCRVVRMTHGDASHRRHSDVLRLPIVGIMAVRARDTAAFMVCAGPGQLGTTPVVTIQAIGVGGEADVPRLLAVSVDASGAMTTFAIRVVVRSRRMPTHLLVADRALVGTDRLRPVDWPRPVIRTGRNRRPDRDTRHEPHCEA